MAASLLRCTHTTNYKNVEKNAGSKSSSHRCYTSSFCCSGCCCCDCHRCCYCCALGFFHFCISHRYKRIKTCDVDYSHYYYNTIPRQEMSQVPFYARLKMRLNFIYIIHIHIQAHTKNSQIIIIWIHASFILRMSNNNECAAVVVNEDDTATDECECAWWKMSVSLLWLPHQLMNHIPHTVWACACVSLCQPAVWHNGTHTPYHSEMAWL